jgi:hypothetical protein
MENKENHKETGKLKTVKKAITKTVAAGAVLAALTCIPQEAHAEIKDLQFKPASSLGDNKAENERTVQEDFAALLAERNEIMSMCDYELSGWGDRGNKYGKDRKIIEQILKDLEFVDYNEMPYEVSKRRTPGENGSIGGASIHGRQGRFKNAIECGREAGYNLARVLDRYREFSILQTIGMDGVENDGYFAADERIKEGKMEGDGGEYELLVDMRNEWYSGNKSNEHRPFDNASASSVAKQRIINTAPPGAREIVAAVIQYSIDCGEFEVRSKYAEERGILDRGTVTAIIYEPSYGEQADKQKIHIEWAQQHLREAEWNRQYGKQQLEEKNKEK